MNTSPESFVKIVCDIDIVGSVPVGFAKVAFELLLVKLHSSRSSFRRVVARTNEAKVSSNLICRKEEEASQDIVPGIYEKQDLSCATFIPQGILLPVTQHSLFPHPSPPYPAQQYTVELRSRPPYLQSASPKSRSMGVDLGKCHKLVVKIATQKALCDPRSRVS